MDLHKYIEEITQLINNQLGEIEISAEIHYDIPLIILPKKVVYSVLHLLKNDRQFGLNFLTTMCGIHYNENPSNKEFSIMYQLHNMQNNTRLRIKVFFSKEDLNIPSITPLWETANWMEREAYDFYGFKFEGHPNLVRILNMEEMNYYPLRKEYALEDGSRIDKEDKYFGR